MVGLLEIIDDPELKKIYMVLEHVELGEIVWRKKGNPSICLYERKRIERELRGDSETGEDEKYFKILQERRSRKEAARSRVSKLNLPTDYWSLEHGDDMDDEEMAHLSRQSTHESLMSHFKPRSHTSHTSMARSASIIRSNPGSGPHSRATSRAPSRTSSTAARTPLPTEFDIGPLDSDNEEDETPGPLPSNHSSAIAMDAHLTSFFGEENIQGLRGRSPSMADSIISHMSSIDDLVPHDSFEEDFSYVPCFTLEQARSTFRDTVLGLEYLHYEGIVHRDIKPANLLWTKDHRVKISDFGVSYFGRPIRDGETEENVSEADAKDFDDDLELAKTVGTPAFFAPELCYTDLDIEQPKVTDQIDVWSLGVTLYCLIFARIPFLAEDEYQLFRAIAQQDVHIPRRRLKAVDPATGSTSQSNLQKNAGLGNGDYRGEGELLMEDVDDELHDLLRRMLLKDPTKRIKLREVKHHPWVIKGIENVIGWLDDTDPSRKTAGKRIQVDRQELEHAVVPITFLERARSAVKKAVGKVIGRPGDGTRRRAVSSATSSGGDMSSQHSPSTPTRDARRASLRGDESYFAAVEKPRDLAEHPLAQSVTASPERPQSSQDLFAQQFLADSANSFTATPRREVSEPDLTKRPSLNDRLPSTTESIQTLTPGRLYHSRSFSGGSPPSEPLPRIDSAPESSLKFTDHNGSIINRDRSRTLHITPAEGLKRSEIETPTRTRSADRTLFNQHDKHGEPSVALSSAIAPGNFEQPIPVKRQHHYTRSEASPTSSHHHISHALRRPSILAPHALSASTPNVPHMNELNYAASRLDDRPSTANRTPEGQTPAPRVYGTSTPESFARAQETLNRRRRQEAELELQKIQVQKEHVKHMDEVMSQAASSCPPSPDDDIFHKKMQETDMRAKSTSTMGETAADVTSPITSPSDVTSPMSSLNLSSTKLGSSEQFFPSDPSLPTLVSGASSVSADLEGDFLGYPGVVHTGSSGMHGSDGTPDTLTPPSLQKQASHESDTTEIAGRANISVLRDEDEEGYNGDGDVALKTEDDDDSDSDEGLTMTRKKPAARAKETTILERRNTNASVGSTETAKKISMAE